MSDNHSIFQLFLPEDAVMARALTREVEKEKLKPLKNGLRAKK